MLQRLLSPLDLIKKKKSNAKGGEGALGGGLASKCLKVRPTETTRPSALCSECTVGKCKTVHRCFCWRKQQIFPVCAQNFGTWNPYKDSVLLRKLMKHQILLVGVVHTTGEVVLLVFCKLLPVHNFYSEQNLSISDLCFFLFYWHVSTSPRWKQGDQIWLLIPRVYDCGPRACNELGADNHTIISPMFVPSCTRHWSIN